MKKLIIIMVLLAALLSGCESLKEEDITNAELTVAGKTYAVVEKTATPADNETIDKDATNIQDRETGYTEPKDTRYYLICDDGAVYSIRNEPIYGDATITIIEYYLRPPGDTLWYYHDGRKILDKASTRVEQVKK